MDSISNIFSNYYTANNVGSVQLRNANLKEILAALLTEYRIMLHSVKTAGSRTPQGAFHGVILDGLNTLGYPRVLTETAELVNYIDDRKFGANTIGATIGYMAKRSKEDFDIRFDLAFAEQELTMDECKLSLLIKAHRLFLAELCKKISRTYNPADIEPGKAYYRKFAGDAEQVRGGKTVKVPTFTEHSSVEFCDYATLLKQVYTRVYAYSDTLSEFIKVFADAALASKQTANKLADEKHHHKTLAEERGSPKMEKKTEPKKTEPKKTEPKKQSKPKPVNNTDVKPGSPPKENAWTKRQSEFELAAALVGAEPVADVVVEVPDEVMVEVPDEVMVEAPDEAFVEVSRKKASAKPQKAQTKNASRTKMLATIS